MPTADLSHPYGIAVEYTGLLLNASRESFDVLAGLSASGTFDGGAPTSTGITVSVHPDIPGHFLLEITAAAMQIEDRAVITVSATNAGAQDLVVTFRVGTGRQWAYGTPESPQDAAAGGTCEHTGFTAPASKLHMVDGRRVVDFIDTAFE